MKTHRGHRTSINTHYITESIFPLEDMVAHRIRWSELEKHAVHGDFVSVSEPNHIVLNAIWSQVSKLLRACLPFCRGRCKAEI